MRILVVAAVVLLCQPGATMANKRVVKRPKVAYGQGINQLVPPVPLPTAYNLAVQATADADKWLGGMGFQASGPANVQQGTPTEAGADPNANAWGYYGQPNILVRPDYLNSLNQHLAQYRGSRHGEEVLLAQLWGLMAHERGHNVGLQHTDTGIMDPALVSLPGEAYAWAASVLPKPLKVRHRKRGR